jgi:hypothetical protein
MPNRGFSVSCSSFFPTLFKFHTKEERKKMRIQQKILMISAIAILSVLATAQIVWSGTTERISISSGGVQANGDSKYTHTYLGTIAL